MAQEGGKEKVWVEVKELAGLLILKPLMSRRGWGWG
jgi:hypothetical protein